MNNGRKKGKKQHTSSGEEAKRQKRRKYDYSGYGEKWNVRKS